MTIGHNRLPALVGVHGKKRAGKGTVADYLERTYGYEVVKFADPLKDMIRVLLRYFGLDEETIERCIESDLKEAPLGILGGKTTRYAMQTLGTEWRELIDSGLWVSIALGRARRLRAEGKRVVIDDLRFPQEMAALRSEGAALWLVTRSRAEEDAATDGHASEKGLPPGGFPVILENETTIEDLYARIERALDGGMDEAA